MTTERWYHIFVNFAILFFELATCVYVSKQVIVFLVILHVVSFSKLVKVTISQITGEVVMLHFSDSVDSDNKISFEIFVQFGNAAWSAIATFDSWSTSRVNCNRRDLKLKTFAIRLGFNFTLNPTFQWNHGISSIERKNLDHKDNSRCLWLQLHLMWH